MTSIVVIGSLNMDLVVISPHLPVAGETVIGTQYLNEPGGKGANQAYAAAKLGGNVAMLGRIGSDDHGQRLKANLAAVGCDVSGLGVIEGASGVAVIVVAASGQNSIVVVPGANHGYLPGDLRADAKHLAGARFVLLQLESPLDTVLAAALAAKRIGAQVILDPAPASDSLPPDLLRSADILTPNETEATRLLRCPPAVNLSVTEARGIARRLQALGASTIIMKLGAQGCLLAQREAMTLVPAPSVVCADTTAAGDVFNGALAVACSEGATLIDACRFAVQAAALSVTRLGAQRSMPSRSELPDQAASPK